MHSTARLRRWHEAVDAPLSRTLSDDEVHWAGSYQRRSPHATINVLWTRQLEVAERRRNSANGCTPKRSVSARRVVLKRRVESFLVKSLDAGERLSKTHKFKKFTNIEYAKRYRTAKPTAGAPADAQPASRHARKVYMQLFPLAGTQPVHDNTMSNVSRSAAPSPCTEMSRTSNLLQYSPPLSSL